MNGTTVPATARAFAFGSSPRPVRKKSASLAGTVLSSGVWIGSPGRAGYTSRGVTMMARSVSFLM